MSHETLEGWCTDPYARHDARWLSDGKPTKLVRDEDVTSYDDPPAGPWIKAPELLEADPAATNGHDLIRADGAQSGERYDKKAALWAIADQLAAQPPSAFDDVGHRNGANDPR
jgi:hypothetical protein